jgi:hypothetical protein
MIKLTMELGGENVEIIVKGKELLFFDISTGMTTTIEGLHLSRSGCVKEFPDLKDDKDWKSKTIERFKQKMKGYETEQEKMNYIKIELEKQGYKSLMIQKAGFRPQLIKESQI